MGGKPTVANLAPLRKHSLQKAQAVINGSSFDDFTYDADI
jgi:hypothetical protein